MLLQRSSAKLTEVRAPQCIGSKCSAFSLMTGIEIFRRTLQQETYAFRGNSNFSEAHVYSLQLQTYQPLLVCTTTI